MAPLFSLWAPWFARVYDTFMRPIERMTLGALRERLLVETSGDVLEIGVGTGVNPNPTMLDQARRAAGRMPVRFELAAAEALPFPDASFDKVVATLVLCSVKDPRRVLKEVRRVLRPDGELLLIEHVRGEGIGGKLQDGLAPPVGRRRSRLPAEPMHAGTVALGWIRRGRIGDTPRAVSAVAAGRRAFAHEDRGKPPALAARVPWFFAHCEPHASWHTLGCATPSCRQLLL